MFHELGVMKFSNVLKVPPFPKAGRTLLNNSLSSCQVIPRPSHKHTVSLGAAVALDQIFSASLGIWPKPTEADSPPSHESGIYDYNL